jgi:2'-5' RNA ligase
VSFADDEYADWQRPAGIFVLAPIGGAAALIVHELQARYDAKLAGAYAPHVTVAGSSGIGPIPPGTSIDELRRRLAPVAEATPVLRLPFGAPQRFMQSDVVSLPLDPHGPLRVLHDGIARSGLQFGPVRFTFTPHVTLNLYRSLTPAAARALLAVRVGEPVVLDRLVLSATDDPRPSRTLLELPFAASAPA